MLKGRILSTQGFPKGRLLAKIQGQCQPGTLLTAVEGKDLSDPRIWKDPIRDHRAMSAVTISAKRQCIQPKEQRSPSADSSIERRALDKRTPIPTNTLCASSTSKSLALGNPVAIGNPVAPAILWLSVSLSRFMISKPVQDALQTASNASNALKQRWRSHDKHLGTYDFISDLQSPNKKARNGRAPSSVSRCPSNTLCTSGTSNLCFSASLWLSIIH